MYRLDIASKEWGISVNTILRYIYQGVIAGIEVCNNNIMLPEIKKPHYAVKSKNPYKDILRAVYRDEYIDYLLLGINEDIFKTYIIELLEKEYIRNVNNTDDLKSNKDLILTFKGNDWVMHPYRALKLNVNLKINGQIGLINVSM